MLYKIPELDPDFTPCCPSTDLHSTSPTHSAKLSAGTICIIRCKKCGLSISGCIIWVSDLLVIPSFFFSMGLWNKVSFKSRYKKRNKLENLLGILHLLLVQITL